MEPFIVLLVAIAVLQIPSQGLKLEKGPIFFQFSSDLNCKIFMSMS